MAGMTRRGRIRDRSRDTRTTRGRLRGSHLLALSIATTVAVGLTSTAEAFRLIGLPGAWARWDAAPRTVEGVERSLDGGLRYSIETGSYAGLRDQLSWLGAPPSAQAFAEAIERAFEHWEVIDAASGLPAAYHFVEDLGTTAVDDPGNPMSPGGRVGLNPGAEIDIFAATPHAGPSFAASVTFFVDAQQHDLTLTSGTTHHAGFAISGVDIRINPLFAWPLHGFEILLTHEIGHALGLADLEAPALVGQTSGFVDDDYDPSTSFSALVTLEDHFAYLIDPFDPEGSPLQSFGGNMNADPGIDTPGVTILMESEDYLDLRFAAQKLQADDVAGRQFLYPVVAPEPGFGSMLAIGGLVLATRRRRLHHPRTRSLAREEQTLTAGIPPGMPLGTPLGGFES